MSVVRARHTYARVTQLRVMLKYCIRTGSLLGRPGDLPRQSGAAPGSSGARFASTSTAAPDQVAAHARGRTSETVRNRRPRQSRAGDRDQSRIERRHGRARFTSGSRRARMTVYIGVAAK